jgi:hypothetical protein
LFYQYKKYDMTVTFALRDDRKRVVQLTLGSEMRTFELEEFTDFWLTMIEEGRKATSAYLESLGRLPRHTDKEDRLDRPRIHEGKGDGS